MVLRVLDFEGNLRVCLGASALRAAILLSMPDGQAGEDQGAVVFLIDGLLQLVHIVLGDFHLAPDLLVFGLFAKIVDHDAENGSSTSPILGLGKSRNEADGALGQLTKVKKIQAVEFSAQNGGLDGVVQNRAGDDLVKEDLAEVGLGIRTFGTAIKLELISVTTLFGLFFILLFLLPIFLSFLFLFSFLFLRPLERLVAAGESLKNRVKLLNDGLI